MTDEPSAEAMTDAEAEVRAWIELNTIGRDDPGAPVRYDIAYLVTLRDALDEARAEIARLAAPLDAPTDEELAALIKPLWLKVRPTREAQAIRSALSVEFDDPRWKSWVADYIPDYVWDLVDIGAQRGISEWRTAPPGASTIDRLRDILSVIDTRDPDLRRLLAERNLFVVESPGASTLERAVQIIRAVEFHLMRSDDEESGYPEGSKVVASAIEQAERAARAEYVETSRKLRAEAVSAAKAETRAAAIEEFRPLLDKINKCDPFSSHAGGHLIRQVYVLEDEFIRLRALAADNKTPAG